MRTYQNILKKIDETKLNATELKFKQLVEKYLARNYAGSIHQPGYDEYHDGYYHALVDVCNAMLREEELKAAGIDLD